MANQFTDQEEIKCSFCGITQDQVKKMIAGNGVYICNECVDLSKKIIDDELRADSVKTASQLPKPMECNGQRYAEDGIGTQFRFCGRAVQCYHGFVDADLVGNIHSYYRGSDYFIHILDCVEYAFAEIAVFVAVAEFEGFVLACRRAAWNSCAAERAGYCTYFYLYGRIAS